MASGALAANGATAANAPETLVKRDASGNFAAGSISAASLSGDGANVANLNAANVATGTLADARLSGNVPLLNGNQSFTGVNTFGNAANSFTGTHLGDGNGLTNLNGANLVSGTVGNAQLAANAVQTANIAAGAVGNTQMAAGAAVANLNASGQSGVGSGGVILSTNPVATSLVNAGYLRIGQTDVGELWIPQSPNGAPSPRYYASAIWSGSELVVWGGGNGTNNYADGARFNYASNSWAPVSSVGAPSARRSSHAVWTGNEMIIWGGNSLGGGFPNNGARYNPQTDSWNPMSTNGAPMGCYENTAVWTGSELLVWGGLGTVSGTNVYSNQGGRYNPLTDTWSAIPTNGAPVARYAHVAVWTGTEMIVWGGVTFNPPVIFGDGARYNPTTGVWTALPASGAPTARYNTSAIWTGSKMLVWGGATSGGVVNTGAAYDPQSNTWSALPTTGAPPGRAEHTAVWTGAEMIIWAGATTGGGVVNSGGRYNPGLGTWTATSANGPPTSRYGHNAVWTGFTMLLFGGGEPLPATQFFGDVFAYQLPLTMYLYLKP